MPRHKKRKRPKWARPVMLEVFRRFKSAAHQRIIQHIDKGLPLCTDGGLGDSRWDRATKKYTAFG